MKVPHTFAEAQKQQLEVTFCATAAQAEAHALTLQANGHHVVAVFQETLEHAHNPLHLVCVEKRKTLLGPQGLARTKQ